MQPEWRAIFSEDVRPQCTPGHAVEDLRDPIVSVGDTSGLIISSIVLPAHYLPYTLNPISSLLRHYGALSSPSDDAPPASTTPFRSRH
jgi:hypothetical protein